MTRLRSAFYCTICDFKNHHYFNIKKQIMTLSEGSCSDIAENTINFTYMINLKIAPIFIKLS